jgi:hypothetical protein
MKPLPWNCLEERDFLKFEKNRNLALMPGGGVVEVYTHECSQNTVLQALTKNKIRARYDSV